VAARTILELGAELISSDAVAIYELVKNAIDAKSPDGVTIEFCVTITHSDFVDALARIDDIMALDKPSTHSAKLVEEKDAILAKLLPSAPKAAQDLMRAAVRNASTLQQLKTNLRAQYASVNWIEFRDTGCGMSKKDIAESYLVIGTPSRRRIVDRSLSGEGLTPTPFLGEKGVGRLSAMRLGSGLSLNTATTADKAFNGLNVDWQLFEDLDKMVGDIELAPVTGGRKPKPEFSGTTIRITGLKGTWSPRRIREIAAYELSRLSDPFSKSKRRFRIEVIFNADRVDIPRMDKAILEVAHAKAVGSYSIENGKPSLTIDLWCGDLGKGNPPEERHIQLDSPDIRSITREGDTEVAASALKSVGPFTFEFHWFNRQRLSKNETMGDRKRVLALQRQWSGIMLFRDGYRVFPYGDDDDDWLGLDRKALASGGYKLNKAQFIGRVSISRTQNPELIDQTNREGLKDCDEKNVLLELLRFTIQDRLRNFLDDVEARFNPPSFDLEASEKRVRNLEQRASAAIKDIGRRHQEEKPQLLELQSLFKEMTEYFASARQRAEQIEDERDRMLQLAGVGLMLEMVAHELARSSEATLNILNDAQSIELTDEMSSVFTTLRDEMKTMNRRLRVLDPLSVSARQRKETFSLNALMADILAGHSNQFQRHSVFVAVSAEAPNIMITGIRGMYVQIIENLIQNSIYWMSLQKLDDDRYKPKIEIKLRKAPQIFEYTDNGPGIQPSLRDEVFKAFFSTKGKSKRQGLGLFIARDCAAQNGANLFLTDEKKIHGNRLNTFVLEMVEEK
jgi:signal transduction histidine kinase